MHRVEWKFLTSFLCLLLAVFVLTSEVGAWPQSEEEQQELAEQESNDADAPSEVAEEEAVELTRVFSGKDTPEVFHLGPMQDHFNALVEKVRPATVGVQVGPSQGSGVIVSRDGYVLTAAHVIGRPDVPATIILPDGTELKAKTLGMDHGIDSGMLKIVDEGKWPYLDVGESETLNTGQWVMAIGHPGGYDINRAPPIRVGRILSSNHERVVQTDCTLVGGDSGGPLVDMDGNVIGIHSRIGGTLSQNFHVPIDTYAINWDDLVAKKVTGLRTRRNNRSSSVYLGLSFKENNSLVLKSVDDDGPAGKAGLQVDDELIRFNDKRITSQTSLRRELAKVKPDDKVKVIVKRGDDELEFEITVESRN